MWIKVVCMHIGLGCFGIVLLIIGINLILAVLFHRSIKKRPVVTEPKPHMAKLVSKQEAWRPPSYDYGRTSVISTPIEPGDPDPPEPYD